jgi:predicted aldo/keto reductase-like oxidoreductase
MQKYIPFIFDCYTYREVYGLTEQAKSMWGQLDNIDWIGAGVGKCTQCGVCSKNCPQGIDIPKKMRDVEKLFG